MEERREEVRREEGEGWRKGGRREEGEGWRKGGRREEGRAGKWESKMKGKKRKGGKTSTH